jgi:basic membrane protein A and related proteins
MRRGRSAYRLLILASALALLAAGCAGGSTGTGTEPAAEAPTELNVGVIFITPVEEPWNTSFLQSWDRAKADNPYGLTINLDYTENVAPPDAERVLRDYARSGKYPVIWAHSSFSDAVKAVKDDFPDILWAYSGAGNEGLGDNAFWVDMHLHEPAYLMGMIAGMMTQSNVLGGVVEFPFPNVNAPLNAFVDGAKSVNEDVQIKATYIESWFDPPKAKESAEAQIAAGADLIYAAAFGPFEAVQQHPDTYAFGYYVDQNDLAPDVVLTSAVARWDPAIKVVLDAWYEHVANGTPYDFSTEAQVFLMNQGGADIAPYHGLESVVPQEAKDAVARVKEDIMAGAFEVPFNEETVASD